VSSVLVSLIPYGIAAAVAAPAAAVVAAFILGKNERPILGGFTFVFGALILDVIVCSIVLGVMEATGAFDGNGDLDAWIEIVLGLVFVGIGVTAIFQHGSPEKEAAQRARIESFTTSGLARIIVLGLVVQVINSDALAIMATGLKEVAKADLSFGQIVVAVAWLLLLMLLPYYIPTLMYVVAPKRSSVLLARFSEWLLAHTRPVEIWTGLLLGGAFLLAGVSALA